MEGGVKILKALADSLPHGNLGLFKKLSKKLKKKNLGIDYFNILIKNQCMTVELGFFLVACMGNLQIVKYLIEGQKLDVNEKDNCGYTVLHFAALGGHLAVVKYLVEERKADINEKDNCGCTVLHFAALGGNLAVVKYLIEERKADINAKDSGSFAVLHFAAFGGNLAVVKYLIEEQKLDVNVKNDYSWTALHVAAKECGNLDVIKYLIEKNADIKAKNSDGFTFFRTLALQKQTGFECIKEIMIFAKIRKNLSLNSQRDIRNIIAGMFGDSNKKIKSFIEKHGSEVRDELNELSNCIVRREMMRVYGICAVISIIPMVVFSAAACSGAMAFSSLIFIAPITAVGAVFVVLAASFLALFVKNRLYVAEIEKADKMLCSQQAGGGEKNGQDSGSLAVNSNLVKAEKSQPNSVQEKKSVAY